MQVNKYNLNRKTQRLTLHGVDYTAGEIARLTVGIQPLPQQELLDLQEFLTDWFNDSPYMTVQTSGSTGVPKQLTVRKDQMIQSASLTCSFLGLEQGDTALLCMSLQYIAGKMMVVRSLVAGLNLILHPPSGHPLADVEAPLTFAAMIPLQVYNSLQIPEEKARLYQTKVLIIGGGAINSTLEAAIRQLPNLVYSTYGMTETLSHIALRRLNGSEASPCYKPFPSVSLSLSADDTLVIHAPLVCDTCLFTNDVAHIHSDGSFVILGRKDNIINSGGIKVQTETIEEILRSIISVTFAITAVAHPKFGEAIVLLVEKPTDTECLKAKISTLLPNYQQPKYIREADKIPLTGSGKTDRIACRKLAATLI